MPAIVDRSHETLARRLVDEAHANDGLAPVDLDRFWADQEVAAVDPFADNCPQAPMGTFLSSDMVYDVAGVPEDYHRYEHDPRWRLEVNRVFNDRAERIVGRRMMNEQPPDPARRYPPIKQLHDIFEAERRWHEQSYWIMEAAHNEDELKALLDRVDQRLTDLRSFVLPAEWDEAKARLRAAGVEPPRYRGQRGPVTFATSIYGAENLIFLIVDNPPLAERLRDTILRAMLGMAELLDNEAGDTVETAPRGFGFADDNCALLTPDMYEFFGYPILKAVFERYAPDPGDRRYQHSDSAMGHLLPILARLNLTECNFGPTLTVREIREHMPHTVIAGQLAPFTLGRNDEVGIVSEFLRDFEQARETKGLRFTTSGSHVNGSRLTGLRLIQAAIQRHGRYD